jgi:hypothetical protein
MKRLFLMFLLFGLAFAVPAFSQQRWERNYGGVRDDEGFSVQQTLDTGYIVAGATMSFGNYLQVYVVKTNAEGDTLWSRTYGGPGIEYGTSVQQTSDGGYIVAGYSDSLLNNGQVYLIKTNASGDTIWTRTYGGTSYAVGQSVQQTSDGGYIVAGMSDSFGDSMQVYLIKTNASGDTLWTKTYGGMYDDRGYSVQQTFDGGYIVAGTTLSLVNGYKVYLIKTNSSGDTLWSKTYKGQYDAYGGSVQQTQDGGYIVSGYDYSNLNGFQVYLIKTNATGDTLWTRTYGGTGVDEGRSVQQTLDGGYIVTGMTNSYGNDYQVYLIKINGAGDTIWTRTYGGALYDEGCSIQQTSDGGYIIGGYSKSFGDGNQVYLIKTDANGNSGVEESRQGDKETRRQGERLRATPNPFTSFATLPGHSSDRFALYDVSGRRVGIYRGDRIGSDVPQGVYFIREENGEGKPVRVVKVR